MDSIVLGHFDRPCVVLPRDLMDGCVKPLRYLVLFSILTNPCRCEERMFCKLSPRTRYGCYHDPLPCKSPFGTGDIRVFHLFLNTEVGFGFDDIWWNICGHALTFPLEERENRSWRKLCVFV
jgi:hypothetical protein